MKVNSEQVLDKIIADVKAGVYDIDPIVEESEVAPSEPAPRQKKPSVFKKILGVLAKILIVLLVTVLLLAGFINRHFYPTNRLYEFQNVLNSGTKVRRLF